MALLNDEILQDVTEMLSDLSNEVKLMVFTQEEECEYCPQIVQLAEEVAATSDQVSVEVNDIEASEDLAAEYEIEMAPAIAIIGEKDYGMRFFGIPSGREFPTLLHGIQKAGGAPSELDDATKSFLDDLDQEVLWQVFVTPTCPYCTRSAVLAYEMAAVSDNLRAEIVESMEFQALASEYNVMGVPLNVINAGEERVEGAAPAPMMIDAIKKALA